MSGEETHDPPSFAQSLTEAIDRRGVALTWLREKLVERGTPVSLATLSYWRSGGRHPDGLSSLRAIEELEDLLRLDAGSLGRLAEVPKRPRRPIAPGREPFSEAEIVAAKEETLRILRAPSSDITREISVHTVTDVDEDGRARARTSRILLEAVDTTVCEVAYTTVSVEHTVGVPRVEFSGASLVREYLHPSEHVYGCVLELDRPLLGGSTAMLEIRMDLSDELHHERPFEDETGTFVTRPVRDIVVWTRFHSNAVPDWIEEIEETGPESPRSLRPIRPEESVHQWRRDFGPGVLGIRWGFEA